MGSNTTVLVLNDALHYIENDPDFGRNLARAIYSAPPPIPPWRPDRPDWARRVDVPARLSKGGAFGNAASVVETHHADQTALVAVGGNSANPLGATGGHRHNEREGAEKLLREIARDLGYRLVPLKGPEGA